MTTVIGTPSKAPSLFASQVATPSVSAPAGVSPTFPVALNTKQYEVAAGMAKQVNFLDIPTRDIILIGNEVEASLHKTLDGFLDRINQGSNPQIFKLITSLQAEVEKQDLGALADRILDAKPTFGDKLKGFFSKKALTEALESAWEQTKMMADGKTKSLRAVIDKLESQLFAEKSKLYNEIKSMDSLKSAYSVKYDEFVVVVGSISMLLQSAKQDVEKLEVETDTQNPQQNAYLSEQKNKLVALESRALALEGTLVRIPADQMVIQDLINAGITTLQETVTTSSSRFASIKMTLITINSAMQVKTVQQIAQAGANLDKNLDAVRSKLMHEVVTTAVSSIGDNRLAQANQIRGIIKDTQELADKVEKLKAENQAKFQQARQIFDESRIAMVTISQKS
jgi:hypothetical protein